MKRKPLFLTFIIFAVVIIVIPIIDFYVDWDHKSLQEEYCITLNFNYIIENRYDHFINKETHFSATEISFNKKYKKLFLDGLLNETSIYSRQRVKSISDIEVIKHINFFDSKNIDDSTQVFCGFKSETVSIIYSTIKVSMLPNYYYVIVYDKDNTTHALLTNTFGFYEDCTGDAS